MARTVCVCRDVIESETDDGLFAAMRGHVDQKHAELGITDEQIQWNMDAMARMAPWDGQPAPLPGPVEAHRLTPEREADFLAYFDREAFVDNPSWASCYCFFYRFEGTREEWGKRTADQNRAAQAAAIQHAQATGYLAYAGGKVVGWCHASPRGDLPLLDAGATEEDGLRIASVVCFNVKPAHRGQGLARTLLNSACQDLAGQGFAVVEAYPFENPRDSGQAYHGPLQMYLAAGFEEVGRHEHIVKVRKRLA